MPTRRIAAGDLKRASRFPMGDANRIPPTTIPTTRRKNDRGSDWPHGSRISDAARQRSRSESGGGCICGVAGRSGLGPLLATRRTRDRARVAERVNAGLCRCGRVPRPGRRRCAQCAAEHTRRRERARAGGLCVRCLRGPPLGDRAVCKRCRDRYEMRRISLKIGRARARAI